MTLTSRALLLLSAQRHHFQDRPDERELTRAVLRRIEAAREQGELVAIVQWDGAQGSENETFSKGWTLYPDFRAEAGDLLVRAQEPDAFAHSDLNAELHGRAVQHLSLLGLEDDDLQATLAAAQALGYSTEVLELGHEVSQ